MNDEHVRRLERRDWWLWSLAIFVMVALALAVLSFSLVVQSGGNVAWSDSERNAVRGLAAFVVVFSAFAIHRQILLNRLRRQLSIQTNLSAALHARAELFQRLAILDPLTGLYNRRFAMQQIVAEIARATRYNHKLTVIYFDINGLKSINDRYGHAAGDLALRGFADALRRSVRCSDITVRMGGDEFLVILPECDVGDLPRVLGRLGQPAVDYRGHRLELHYAAGHAEYVRGESAEELLERADHNAYDDKHSGSAEQQGIAARELDRQTEKLTTMGWLTASVAHDFNNLLTVMKGYTELILDRADLAPDLREQMEEISNAAQRASAMTGQLLAFSRKQAIEPKVVVINELITSTEAMLHRLISKNIDLKLDLGENLYSVCVDSGQFVQVLMNLVINARDAMPGGGELLVQTSNAELDAEFCALHRGAREGSYVRLLVRDNGVGMDEQIRNRVFEPFFTTKGAGKGTGLGLSTVYGIVKQTGGYIWVDSELGRGTAITIYIPRMLESGEILSLPPQPALAEVKVDPHQQTVLVVESFASLRHLICDFLRNEGYNVLETGSAEEAIYVAAEAPSPIRLLVIDTILPGMSGLELAESLCRHRQQVKVLYVSGYAEDSLLLGDWKQPGAQFLGAPFTAGEFLSKLRTLLTASQ